MCDEDDCNEISADEVAKICDQVIEQRRIQGFWDVCFAYVTRAEIRLGRAQANQVARDLDISRATVKNWRDKGWRGWAQNMRLILGHETALRGKKGDRIRARRDDWRWIAEQLYSHVELERVESGGSVSVRRRAEVVQIAAARESGRGHLAQISAMTLYRHRNELEHYFESMRQEGVEVSRSGGVVVTPKRVVQISLRAPEGDDPF